jgi:hypothetical protein
VKTGWIVTWRDEKAWTVTGPGVITRRFAALSGNPAKPTVGEVQRAPAIWLGGSGGRFVSGGDRALFVSTEVGGRGQHVWTAALFDGGTAAALKNPNADTGQLRMSGWDAARMIPVIRPGSAVDGPVAGDWGCDSFVLVAGEPQEAKRGAGVLYGARLDRDGKRLDPKGRPSTLVDGQMPLANPVLRFGGDRGVLVFEQRDKGRSTLRGGVLRCSG